MTREGAYIQQQPDLQEVDFNFTVTASNLPIFLSLEEDQVFGYQPGSEPFTENQGGLYTSQEIQGNKMSYGQYSLGLRRQLC